MKEERDEIQKIETKPEMPYALQLSLLLKTVKSLGVNIDIITLDLILSLRNLVLEKGANISLNDIEILSQAVINKYQEQKQQ